MNYPNSTWPSRNPIWFDYFWAQESQTWTWTLVFIEKNEETLKSPDGKNIFFWYLLLYFCILGDHCSNYSDRSCRTRGCIQQAIVGGGICSCLNAAEASGNVRRWKRFVAWQHKRERRSRWMGWIGHLRPSHSESVKQDFQQRRWQRSDAPHVGHSCDRRWCSGWEKLPWQKQGLTDKSLAVGYSLLDDPFRRCDYLARNHTKARKCLKNVFSDMKFVVSSSDRKLLLGVWIYWVR